MNTQATNDINKSYTFTKVADMSNEHILGLLNEGARLTSGKPYAECDGREKAMVQTISCIEAAEAAAVTA